MTSQYHYTENNHLRYGWLSNQLFGGQRTFFTKIGSCRYAPESPFIEAVKAAKLIAQNFPQDLVLCMSGGIDSECMALAFLAAKVPFRVAIGSYSQGLNKSDIESAYHFCNLHHIEYETIEIDLVDYFSKGKHMECAQRFECRSPQLAVHMEMMSQIKGVPVLSWNPSEIRYNPAMMVHDIYLPAEPHLAYHKFFEKQNRPGVPFFFAYTPELIYSFWQTPQFLKELKFAESRKNSKDFTCVKSYQGKVKKYQEGGFSVLAKEDKKTGFEEAKLFFSEYLQEQKVVSEPFPGGLDPFDFCFRRPMVELNPYPFPTVRIFSKEHFPQTTLFDLGNSSYSRIT
jgi:hypothetical protein